MRKRILIVGPTWVGDSVIAQSLYRHIKQLNATTTIDVLVPKYLHGLLGRMPEIRRTIDMPLTHGELGLRKRRRIGHDLRGYYDRAIVLPRSFKAALIPWFAKIATRTGFCGEMRYGLINDMRHLDNCTIPRLANRYVLLGQHEKTSAPQYILPPRLIVKAKNARRCIERLGLKCNNPILILAPGTADEPAKKWPINYFSEIAKHYANEGYQIWILGSENDQAAGHSIANIAEVSVNNLCGRTSLEDTVDILAQADIVISNDSGLMHIAAAVGTPVVGIFGSTTPEYTLPISNRVGYLWKQVPCSPCWQQTCRYGHYRCLTEITPTDVISVVSDTIKLKTDGVKKHRLPSTSRRTVLSIFLYCQKVSLS